MPNEHLKTALTRAGLTAEEFADILSVDPKTVQRWVAGRTPYARHRQRISRALDCPEHELWPDTVPAPSSPAADDAQTPPGSHAVTAWANWSEDGAPQPVALLTDVADEADLLDPVGTLLLAPGIVSALQNLVANGCRVRVITTELMPGQTPPPAWVQLGWRPIPNVSRNPTVLRVDDTMLIAHINGLWDRSRPPDVPAPEPAAVEPDPTPEIASDAEPARQWPRRPA
jgi:transcriptional regulator with XRE-family HTH domain